MSNRLAIQHYADNLYIIEFMESSIVDQLTIAQINQDIKAVVERAGAPKLVFDFSNVTHVSSAMLGVLMTQHKACKAAGGDIRLCGINKNIMQVFKLTRLDKMMKIFPNQDQAIAKF